MRLSGATDEIEMKETEDEYVVRAGEKESCYGCRRIGYAVLGEDGVGHCVR